MKVLLYGAGGIAAFGAVGALAVWLLTRDSGTPGGAAADAGAQPANGEVAAPTPMPMPGQGPGPAQAPPAPVVPERIRNWTPEAAAQRFEPADAEHPYDPGAEAKRKQQIDDALRRGRRGKPPRSAEDED